MYKQQAVVHKAYDKQKENNSNVLPCKTKNRSIQTASQVLQYGYFQIPEKV